MAPEAGQPEAVESEWAGSKQEAWAPAETAVAALAVGGFLLAPGERVPRCPRRRGCETRRARSYWAHLVT